MDILATAEEHFVISFGISLGIGLLHGSILGRGIRNRFPSFKRHATIVSFTLLILFTINAIVNVIKFAFPEKIIVSNLDLPSTPEAAISFLIGLLGLDAGLLAVIVTFISISLILFFKLANIHKIARYFIFILSVIVFLVALVSRFTEFIPSSFQILMYALYQFGITMGIFLVTRRNITDVLAETA